MDKTEHEKQTKIIIYGGNGFVGTRVAKHLAALNVCTVCLSRSGHKPLHLKDESWSEDVRWCKGDASEPSIELLSTADVLICLVGSPPLPTFSDEAYEKQVFMNGTTNVNAIEGAEEAGIKRVVLLGAKLPFFMQRDSFGYSKGKRLAYEAAEQFSKLSNAHSATVLQPGAIYGTRHLEGGKSLPLGVVMKPMSHLMPWQFVSVDDVARSIVEAALTERKEDQGFTVLSHNEIKA